MKNKKTGGNASAGAGAVRFLTVPPEAAGMLLSDWFALAGIAFPLPCGGRGICGGCTVTLADGSRVPACSYTVPKGGISVRDPSPAPAAAAEPSSTPRERPDMALDIGTTTLELALVGDGGATGRSVTALNPQAVFGADVISRITACREGKLTAMRTCLTETVNSMIHSLSPGGARTIYAVGNPTMAHIFCGVSPEPIGTYPFTPVFTGTRELRAESGLDAGRTVLLPAASAFIGSDITAGLYASGIFPGEDRDGPVLFCDLGTNGETVLKADGRLLCASSAAGPALEAAGISCGTGGVGGAVSEVYDAAGGAGELKYSTVGGLPPAGICGSGLCDLVACLVERGVITADGRLTSPGGFALCPNVLLTQKDVRNFQLAQSAVRAAVETLLATAGIRSGDIASVILAGGLGSRIRPSSAVRASLFPSVFEAKIRQSGNTALKGAAACAADPDAVVKLEEIAAACETVDLVSSDFFASAFIGNMRFG
ncbi:MAG: DUF4445 domain-containing protein [Clostridia bacterium]|nr:DUF4445 domain-containing protein [Clostridia bacterium]